MKINCFEDYVRKKIKEAVYCFKDEQFFKKIERSLILTSNLKL